MVFTKKDKGVKCPSSHCGFDLNTSNATICEICQTPLKGYPPAPPSPETRLEGKAKKKKRGSILVLGAASLGATIVATVILVPRYWSIESVPSKELITEQSGDIRLYDSMEAVPNVPEGIFNYGGAICFAAMQRDGMNTAINEANSQYNLRYIEPLDENPGCSTGIKMLLDKQLSFAQNGRPLTEDEYKSAQLRGFELESVPVAIDGIVFYVNKSSGIKSLSIDQVRDIYFGKITNWQEVGGQDLPIVPISLDPKTNVVLKLVMKKEEALDLGNDVEIVRDYTTAIRRVGATDGGISYASAAILKRQTSVRPIALAASEAYPPVSALLADESVNLQAFEQKLYPLTRRLFVVIRRDGTPEEKAGVAYTNFLLSKEGQKIIQSAGFVPLYSD